MPHPVDLEAEPAHLPSLAAAAEEEDEAPPAQSAPSYTASPMASAWPHTSPPTRASSHPVTRNRTRSRPPLRRPEGSFAARALGNAVHAFLELLAARIAAGATPEALTAQLPAWASRISTVLRSSGLPPATVERLTPKVQLALNCTLADPVGRWILAAHPDAASEQALTAADDRRSGVRLDRTFRAGREPLAPGTDYLWIVDFKTATHGREGLRAFLAREREKYTAQMHTYAHVLAEPRIRTMLFYPLLAANTWWAPELYPQVQLSLQLEGASTT